MDPTPSPSDHADVRVLPPVLYLGSLFLGVALHWISAMPTYIGFRV